jgi:hypothetical protein
MVTRWLLILLIFVLTSCQYGLIPCPTYKGDRMKRSKARLSYYSPRMMTASVEETKKQTSDVKRRPDPVAPPLEHIDVEEWDCPKPGQKKVPKAVKDNIRKNKKAYGSYYKSRMDSVSANPVNK